MMEYFDKEKFFYWILGMSAAVIALPYTNFSPMSVILLFAYWLFYPSVREKYDMLKINWSNVLILSIPFFIQVVGLTYSDDFHRGLLIVQLVLPFIVYALVMQTVKLETKVSRFILFYFFVGTFIASVMGIGKAMYYKMNALGDYFYYSRFSELLGKHTTAFSLFVVVSMLYLIYESLKKHRRWVVTTPFLVFFLLVLYLVSTRISIVALTLGIVVLAITEMRGKARWIGLVLPIVLIGFYSTPNFQKRFDPSDTERGEVSDVVFRRDHWKSVWETINHQPLLIGNGTGSDRSYLFERYKSYQLTSAYQQKYNAHNQFLEYMLDTGLMGLTAFLLYLGFLMNHFIRERNGLGLAVMTVLISYCMTESLLTGQNGVMAFSLVITTLFVGKGFRDK